MIGFGVGDMDGAIPIIRGVADLDGIRGADDREGTHPLGTQLR